MADRHPSSLSLAEIIESVLGHKLEVHSTFYDPGLDSFYVTFDKPHKLENRIVRSKHIKTGLARLMRIDFTEDNEPAAMEIALLPPPPEEEEPVMQDEENIRGP